MQLDSQGNSIGKDDANSIFDSRVYNMELPNVGVEENSVNTMIENLIEQIENMVEIQDCSTKSLSDPTKMLSLKNRKSSLI